MTPSVKKARNRQNRSELIATLLITMGAIFASLPFFIVVFVDPQSDWILGAAIAAGICFGLPLWNAWLQWLDRNDFFTKNLSEDNEKYE